MIRVHVNRDVIPVNMLNFEDLEVGTVMSNEEALKHPLFDNEAWSKSVFDPKYLPRVIVRRSNGEWCVASWGGNSSEHLGSYIWTVGPDYLEKTVPIESLIVRMPRSIWSVSQMPNRIPFSVLNFEWLEVGTVVSNEEALKHPLFDYEAWAGSAFNPLYLPQVIVKHSLEESWCVACSGGNRMASGSHLWTIGYEGDDYLQKTVPFNSLIVRMPRSIVSHK